jgi:predicted amidohydrolase YtcJ
VKLYADGALGSRGARLYAEYDDDRGNRGLWVTEPEQLAFAVEIAISAGWQVAVHAIGDAAIGSVLDAYLAAQKKYPGDHRPRIEHLQVLAPSDLPRLVESRAIASMQPTHATSDMPWAEQRVGAQRIKGAYAWRTVIDKGVPLAAGSDFPVEEVSPLLGIYAAVTRQDGSGAPAGGWYPAQRMTLDEAISAFTYGAAYAGHAEGSLGRLAPGRLADLTVFDGPLAEDRSLLERGIALTIVGGEIVHEARPGGEAR